MKDRTNQHIQKLMDLPKFGKGIGLHRMNYLCQDILASKWGDGIDPINVVGSNGKGSTTVIISNILCALGISTGQYTSPHLFDFSERIVVDGAKISQAELAENMELFNEKYRQFAVDFPNDQIGAFEALTFLGLSHFYRKRVEAVVLEAGIGGRYDATRVFTGHFVAFTSLDLEHTKVMGNSKELIAYDKIDIAKEGTTVVVGEMEEEVLRRLTQYARLKQVKLMPVGAFTKVNRVDFQEDKMVLDFEVEECSFSNLASNLTGYHQVQNILVAVLLTKKWLARNYPEVGKDRFVRTVHKALQQVKWTGRLEKIRSNPPVYIDVGHTPAAIRTLVKSFQEINQQPCLLITGVSLDKEISKIVEELTRVADAVVCTSAYHKGAEASEIFQVVKPVFVKNDQVFQFDRIEEAVDFSMDYAQENGMSVLVAGGLFLASEVYHYLDGQVPAQLRFF